MTLNNQLVALNCKVGDAVQVDSWYGLVFMNEFGLGIEMVMSHDPRPICDGLFPALPGLKKLPKLPFELL